MITEDYCSFELAKLLKEKGFIEMCYMYYEPDKHGYARCGERFENHNYVKGEISCPTHQMVMKWLRKKGIDIIIMPVLSNEYNEKKYYVWQAVGTRGKADTFEEAVDVALKCCLTELI